MLGKTTKFSFIRDGKLVNITVEDTDLTNNDDRFLADILYEEFSINNLPNSISYLLNSFYHSLNHENIKECKNIFEKLKTLNVSNKILDEFNSSITCLELLTVN